ncbi:MAG: pro-sigmaK processing inhibitor BofA family protein [Eubacteriaceae bacterium]|nr:pro-sigmaK processing inhibitor BofA family protein [Eubacteriaceae bacterium]
MGTEMGVFLTFGGMLILIFLFGRILVVPIKIILKLILNSIAGAILLILINFIGANFGILVPINIITAVTVGILGIPGTIMLLVFAGV